TLRRPGPLARGPGRPRPLRLRPGRAGAVRASSRRAGQAPAPDQSTGQQDFALAPEAEPAIWELSRSVADEVGTRPADAIVLMPWGNAQVHEEGHSLRLLVGGSRRVLTLGAPLLIGLSTGELRSILVHEYAHCAHRDTPWGVPAARARAALGDAIANLHSDPG